jgi:alpha-tubulin suppressor-like RCC1 family protein/uncharacterized protein YkwD
MTCANADTPANHLAQTVAEEAVLCLINEQRAANGAPALTLNTKLRDAARLHAAAAKTIQWWAGGGSQVHINPETGSTPQSRIRAADYCPGEIDPPPQTNENCYDGLYSGNTPAQTPRDAVTWWMNSQGHRDTLLDKVYLESGVAVVLGIAEKLDPSVRPAGGVIVVQTFGACKEPETPSEGQGWAWGNNEAAQMGDDTTINRPTPVRPHGLSGVVAVAAANWHSLALKNDGSVWAWGYNTHGQLGDGDGSVGTLRKTPVQVSNLSEVVAIAAGIFHSLALKNDGSVWAWGDNASGQLGDGTTSDQSEPVKLFIPDISGAVAIAAGYHHSLLLTNDARVWAWGSNKFGQLGDGTTGTHRLTPAPVDALRNVTAIAGGARHSLALTGEAGEAWAWGDNANGQLGDNTFLPRSTPGTVHFSSSTLPVVAIAAGGFHSLAVSKAGGIDAYSWGANAYGQLGKGDYDDHWLPGGVGGLIQSHVLGLEVIAVAGGLDHSLALMDDGSVWAWGRNDSGQLGDGTTTPYRWRAEQVANVSGVVGGIACGTDCSLTP